MYGGPAEVMQQIDRDVAAARQRADDVHATRLRMDAVSGRATTRAGDVTVEVDSGGAVRSLELTPAATDRRADQLAAAILQTMREAQQQVAGQISELAEATFGAASPVTARIQGEVRTKFVPPEETDGVRWGSSDRPRGSRW